MNICTCILRPNGWLIDTEYKIFSTALLPDRAQENILHPNEQENIKFDIFFETHFLKHK